MVQCKKLTLYNRRHAAGKLLVWNITNIPGDPLKLMCLTLFLNSFKSSKDKTKLLGGKEAEFYKNCSDIIDLKI